MEYIPADDKELFKKYKETGNIDFRNRIVEKYLYIVNILVKRYLNKGIEYDDLYQVGSMALVLAADRFDPDKGRVFCFCNSYYTGRIEEIL